MRTYCKPADVNIEDVSFISPAVHRCFTSEKLKKWKFQKLLISTGKISRAQLRADLATQDRTRIVLAIDAVAEEMAKRIRARDLQMPPVRQFRRRDRSNGKLRDLCSESAEQQIFEYIAVYALMPLFTAKILPFQYGSIPDRGQIKTMERIARLVRKNEKQMCAIQCDVRKAYPSTKVSTVMDLLRRDIGKNKTLLWYTEALMQNYPNGALLIGGYWSPWAFNYAFSYALRVLLDQVKVRRGKRIPMVSGVANYADDFVVFGQKSNLTRVIKVTVRWAKKSLGLDLKDAWKVIHFSSFSEERELKKERQKNRSHLRTQGVDMVGYVVRPTYTIVRGTTFVHFRRQFLRAARNISELGYVPWWRAQKITADWGWIKHSDCTKFCEIYSVYKIVRACKKSVSWHDRKVNKYGGKLCSAAC